MADRRRPTLAIVVGVLLGAMLLVALLLTPAADDSRGQLISTSAAPGGARALHDLQLRSGWQVERMDVPYADRMDSSVVYAVLDPLVGLTASEVHRLLEAVRGGASLLVVISNNGSIADSLGMSPSKTGALVSRADEAPDGFCADSLNRPGLINWPGGRVQSYWLDTKLRPAAIFTSLEPMPAVPGRPRIASKPGDTVGLGSGATTRGRSRIATNPGDTARLSSAATTRGRSRIATNPGDTAGLRPKAGTEGRSRISATERDSVGRSTAEAAVGRSRITTSLVDSVGRSPSGRSWMLTTAGDTVWLSPAQRTALDSAMSGLPRDSAAGSALHKTALVQVRTRVETTAVAMPRLAMAGYTLGRGRVVAVADADLLRNDVLRVCRWNAGPNAARALDWLAVTAGKRLVFDEFHQSPTAEADPVGAIGRALVHQPWGRMVFVGALSGLILLAAAGMRPMSPEPLTTVQRRSPLEHVRALARAYESAGSTRLVARRLVRGLRRRHALTSLAGGDDEAFLTALAERHPSLASDAELLRKAMAEPVTTAQLPTLGDAVARIDSRLRPNI